MKGTQLNEEEIYSLMYEFLESLDGVDAKIINMHLKPELKPTKELSLVYKRFVFSAQNRQMSTNVIGNSIGGLDKLSKVLFGFNPHRVAKKYSKGDGGLLFNDIKIKLKPNGKLRANANSIWPRFCETTIQAAIFISQFENGTDFNKWVKGFIKDVRSISALPQLISSEVYGIGFPLACDFLKEIGFTEFGKPDVHIKKILIGLGFINLNTTKNNVLDFITFKCLQQIALKNNVSAFEIDKLLWLIGSGRFYRVDLFTGRNSVKFINFCNKRIRR